MFKPRPYQQKVLEDVKNAVAAGHRDVCLVAPTGAGKTCVGAFLVLGALTKQKRVWFSAPLDALIDQTYDSFIEVLEGCGIDSKMVGVIHPSYKPHYNRPIQVVAQKTAALRIASGDIDPRYYPSILMEDECHTTSFRTASKSMCEAFEAHQKISVSYRFALRLGLTGSPDRTSNYESMGQQFSAAVFTPNTEQLTYEMGMLAELKVYEGYEEGALAQTVASGYDADKIRVLYNTPEAISKAIELYEETGEQGKAIAFCVDVDHAQSLAAEFQRRGYVAEAIDYKTPRGKKTDVYPEKKTRRSMIQAYKEGKIQILTGKDVLAVGFDCKDAIVAMLLRPTDSLSTHIQQLGRVRRIARGKPYGIVLDMVGNCKTHGYGLDEWSERDSDGNLLILEIPGEKGDGGDNPFEVMCISCDEGIHAQLKICPHCGAEQPKRESEIEEVSFAGGLIETLLPQRLDSNSEADAKRYYRNLRQRAVLVDRALPGLGYLRFSESKLFGKWAGSIPREPSTWTLGAVFNAPDSVSAASDFYKFLQRKISSKAINPQDQYRKVWYSMQLEFFGDVVEAVRLKVNNGELTLTAAEPEITQKPVKVSKLLVPNWQ